MKVALTFSTFTYSGWSIGRDIRVEVVVAGKTSTYEKRMRPFYFTRPDIPLGVVEVEEGREIPVTVTVIEKDRVYPDTGEVRITIITPQPSALPKAYTAELQVTEHRFVFWKATATFTIGIEARAIPQESPALRQYRSYRDENYNRYDNVISEVVTYWNDQFAQDTDPPSERLDPNLVKAMAYQETRVGNDPLKNGLVDIMQAGNEKDPALKTLRGEKTEFWTHHGEQIKLKYLDAKIETVYDSVFWGVRWLYHKAHKNIRHEDGSWGNTWRPWKEAVERYGPGDFEYAENIWSVYTKGVSNRDGGTKLWSFVGFLWFVFLPFFGIGVSDGDIRRSFEENFAYRKPEFRKGIDVVRSTDYPSFFAAVEDDGDDWSEILTVGRTVGGKIIWFPEFGADIEPANGILSARFMNLEGFNEPIIEVWSLSHRGGGFLDLYRANDAELVSLVRILAVDAYREDGFQEDGFPEYGGGYNTCGSVYEGHRLFAEYADRNGDGVSDVILNGIEIVECDKIIGYDNKGYIIVQTDEVERRAVSEQVHYLKKNDG